MNLRECFSNFMLIFAPEIFLSSKYVIIIIVLTLNLKEQMKKINLFLFVPTALLMVASIFLFTSCEADDEGQTGEEENNNDNEDGQQQKEEEAWYPPWT